MVFRWRGNKMVGNVINSMARAKCNCESCIQIRKERKKIREEIKENERKNI